MIRIKEQFIYGLISFIILMAFPALAAQDQLEKGPLQVGGTVTTYDGTPLTGVEIIIIENGTSVFTNDAGAYVIADPPKGTFTLIATLDGFEENEIEVEFFDVSRTINFTLNLSEIKYEVTVRADMPELMDASSSIGVVSIDPKQLTSLPSLGEKDIFRTIQMMPGVSASNEASSGLYVRGGTPDQNLILLDGMNIYEVDHFYGIFSAFNSSAVSNISMHKGAFEAEYGERLSSVVDMTGRSGIGETPVFGGGASFLSANGYVDVPIGDIGSFMIAGRKSYNTFLSNQIHDAYDSSLTQGFGGGGGRGPGGNFETQPVASFWDTNIRANFNLGSRDSLVFAGYFGRDNLDNSRINELSSYDLAFSGRYQEDTDVPESLTMDIGDISNWGNNAGSVNWIRTWSNNFTTKVTGSTSYFFRDYDRTTSITEVDYDGNELDPVERGSLEHNKVNDYTFKLTNYYTPFSGHNLVFGAQATNSEVDYFYEMTQSASVIDNSWSGNTYSGFAKDIFSPVKWLTITPGIRATYYDVTEKTYIDPRLSMILQLNDEISLKAGGGDYHQFTSRLLRENPMEGDKWFWMMADDELIPVSKSRNITAGISWENPEFLFNMELYDRQLSGLSEFASTRFRPGNDDTINLYEQFYTGDGFARGIELLLQKKYGKHTGWVTLTRGEVEYDFPDFQDLPYHASHDSTYEFKLVDSYKWRNFIFSGTWIYATGKPYTAPTGEIDEFEVETPEGDTRTFEQVELGDKNSLRLPAYHRLDLSAKWDFLNKDGNKGNIGVSVFNAYNNSNVWRYEYQAFDEEIYTTEVNYLGFTISAFINFDIGLPTQENQAGPISGSSEFQSYSEAKAAKKKEPVWDFHGTVESIDLHSLTTNSKWGRKVLVINDATIKGEPTYAPGTPVHVYYKKGSDDQLIVTMVFQVVE
jgi:ferric enterobactin receptor